jgi:hypothetical protein
MTMNPNAGNPFQNVSAKSLKLILTLAGVGIALLIGVVLTFSVAMPAVNSWVGRSSFYDKNTTAPPPKAPPKRTVATQGDPPEARGVAEDFLDDVGSMQLRFAYDKTTRNFKDTRVPEEMKILIEKSAPAFLGFTSKQLAPIRITEARITYRGTVMGPRGSANFRMDVTREGNDAWLVDRLDLE